MRCAKRLAPARLDCSALIVAWWVVMGCDASIQKSHGRLDLRRYWPAWRLRSTCGGRRPDQSGKCTEKFEKYKQLSAVVLIYIVACVCRVYSSTSIFVEVGNTPPPNPKLHHRASSHIYIRSHVLRLGPVVVSLLLPALLERLHLPLLLLVFCHHTCWASLHSATLTLASLIGGRPTSSLQARQSFFS